ncbi:MAG: SOS response-associated peptidase [Rhodococcus sp.]|nr:SOS response-associated peptidase [Rhodococcus sp. (in: high G+C Gram-positive bacteria)]
MCGRYATTANPATLAADLDAVDEVSDLDEAVRPAPKYNVAPTDRVCAVVDRHGSRRIRGMRWGLVPPWTKQLGKGPMLINARAESLAEKPAFRTSFQRKRCLVPMDGWFEWETESQMKAGSRTPKAVKIPYFMTPQDGSRLFVAGLWSVWHDPATEAAGESSPAPLLSCSVVTVDSAAHLTEVHDRMPLVLPRDRWAAWLDPESTADPRLLEPVLDAYADIEVRRVSTQVNSVKNDGPELIEPLTGGQADDDRAGEQITLL